MRIVIIQHCQSEHHINEMSGGWTDTPLTELGREQARRIGKRLQNELDGDFTLYSSDLRRALQTTEIVASYLDLEINVNPDLREINTGIAAGKTKEWVRAHRKPRGEIFDPDFHEFEGSESWRDFYLRVSSVMKRITEQEKNNLIIVTHGGTLGYIIAWWMGMDNLERAYFRASPASISVLGKSQLYKDQHTLDSLNDKEHLL